MKKILAVMLVLIMLFSFAGCDSDFTHSERVKKEGKLVVGVTEFEPMTYKENGEWTGFDVEFAKLFAKEKLKAEVEFVEIIASERFEKLQKDEVDCVWTGLTQLQGETASFSNLYMKSAQVLVMKADRVNDYNDGFEIKDLKFVVEKASAGAFYIIERNGFPNIKEVKTKKEALDMVASGEADATVIDYAIANAVTGDGKKYADLGIGFDFSDEGYSVAFRTDSDMAAILNEFIAEVKDDELKKLADKYGLTLNLN